MPSQQAASNSQPSASPTKTASNSQPSAAPTQTATQTGEQVWNTVRNNIKNAVNCTNSPSFVKQTLSHKTMRMIRYNCKSVNFEKEESKDGNEAKCMYNRHWKSTQWCCQNDRCAGTPSEGKCNSKTPFFGNNKCKLPQEESRCNMNIRSIAINAIRKLDPEKYDLGRRVGSYNYKTKCIKTGSDSKFTCSFSSNISSDELAKRYENYFEKRCPKNFNHKNKTIRHQSVATSCDEKWLKKSNPFWMDEQTSKNWIQKADWQSFCELNAARDLFDSINSDTKNMIQQKRNVERQHERQHENQSQNNLIYNGKSYVSEKNCQGKHLLKCTPVNTSVKDIKTMIETCSNDKNCKSIMREDESKKWCTFSDKVDPNNTLKPHKCWKKLESGVKFKEVDKTKIESYQCIRPTTNGSICANIPLITSALKYNNYEMLPGEENSHIHHMTNTSQLFEEFSPLISSSDTLKSTEVCYSLEWPGTKKVQGELQEKLHRKMASPIPSIFSSEFSSEEKPDNFSKLYDIFDPQNVVVCAYDKPSAAYVLTHTALTARQALRR